MHPDGIKEYPKDSIGCVLRIDFTQKHVIAARAMPKTAINNICR